MKDIRIGIIGSGGMAKRRAQTFSGLDRIRVEGVAARNPVTRSELSGNLECRLVDDWRALVDSEEIDAIAIFTHNELHGEIARAALENGKHVFSEYPAARFIKEIRSLRDLIGEAGPVYRVAHSENVSASHRQLKKVIKEHGQLRFSHFIRLTPGRGARPEVLFNLERSGPPTLFFVYHIYPMIDIFGPILWLESKAEYAGLEERGQYESFFNSLEVGFASGGFGHWVWAGGIEINRAEESARIVLSTATLRRDNGPWQLSTRDGLQELQTQEPDEQSLEEQFRADIEGGGDNWREDAMRALHAAEIGILAEESARRQKRIKLS